MRVQADGSLILGCLGDELDVEAGKHALESRNA